MTDPIQTFHTSGDEELVVLTRRHYDALLAAAGDPDAEQRRADSIVKDVRDAIGRGEEIELPDWLALPVARGETALKVVRERSARPREEIANAAHITSEHLSDLERGVEVATPEIRLRIAAALGVDHRWFDE